MKTKSVTSSNCIEFKIPNYLGGIPIMTIALQWGMIGNK